MAHTPKTARAWAKQQGWTRESAVVGGWQGLADRLNAGTVTATYGVFRWRDDRQYSAAVAIGGTLYPDRKEAGSLATSLNTSRSFQASMGLDPLDAPGGYEVRSITVQP